MYDYTSITLTQGIFLCCLFVVGPAFGFVAVYRHIQSRLGGLWSFLFATFCAYAGWFISGVTAMLLFPDYPYCGGPSEFTAILFTIPGFVTGWFGLRTLSRFADRSPQNMKEVE
jgi:hypothetical protein